MPGCREGGDGPGLSRSREARSGTKNARATRAARASFSCQGRRGPAGSQLQPDVVPQFTHLWQLPFGIMIDPHSGQVGASVRAMKLKLGLKFPFA